MGISGERPGDLFKFSPGDFGGVRNLCSKPGVSPVKRGNHLSGWEVMLGEMCHIHVMANWAAGSFRKNASFILCSLACHPPGFVGLLALRLYVV